MRFANTAERTVLVIAPDFPYPPNHGGRLDVWRRLAVLRRLGYEVDLLATTKQKPCDECIAAVTSIVRTLKIVPRVQIPTVDFISEPYQVASRRLLKRTNIRNHYHFALLEGHYVAPILENPSLDAANLVLRIHNDETRFFCGLAASTRNPARKVFYYREAQLMKRATPKIERAVANLLYISSTEYDRALPLPLGVRGTVLPPALANPPVQQRRKPVPGTVLFVGSLFMPNNREAIEWYLRNIHSNIDEPGYRLLVAGNTNGKGADWMRPYLARYDNVEFHPDREDLHTLYEEAEVFVNPLLHGAGVKLKAIEAIRHGVPVVTTERGIEGTRLEGEVHVALASSTAEAFESAVKRLLREPELARKMSRRATERIESAWDHGAILGSFLEEVAARP